ncbi:CLUMA_CG000996, isoform A [Clunio marinus]|uniref:CLUMA_CG000996, isoform A n=1 Tax=Clunio marinus TaxID=568069 RepID=A0A1J1HGQ3_9DIPT|nr:CLUMA_CG000996, isoform A [Clunio marinus]
MKHYLNFTPRGNIFGLKNAIEASRKNDTAIILKGIDGVVLALRKKSKTFYFNQEVKRRREKYECSTHIIGSTIVLVTSGLVKHCNAIVAEASKVSKNYNEKYNKCIPLKTLTEQLAHIMNKRTHFFFNHPFYSKAILFTWNIFGSELYQIEPSGEYFGYSGCVAGKWENEVKEVLFNLNFKSTKAEDFLVIAAGIALMTHNLEKKINQKAKSSLTLVWIGKKTNGELEKCCGEHYKTIRDLALTTLKEIEENKLITANISQK